ncbi:hypothetical protein [Burkholderia territorii]|uniref:hypothetical protein n=1 Tax=Burkholderia territorii TaxID=1503055 RepID=UPI000751FF79|nr:hypothetical protein [Burkholderia territorii]KWE37934.1 hypothetical protein WT49_10240 [Burkholderia territorii]KWE41441.1 hypothetical protein WT50_15205 [Burkholderia territorii]KWE41752.1 hypothetical protein WT51_25290 [Burkholderia territorii]
MLIKSKPDRKANGIAAKSARRGWSAIARMVRAREHIVYPAVALIALGSATVFTSFSHQRLQAAYERRDTATRLYDTAQQALSDARRRVERARMARTQMTDAMRAGYGVGQWAIRRMDIRQAVMTRETVNEMLSQISRTPSQMFGADEFELSMKSADGGLFEVPAANSGDTALLVTLAGTLYFRLGAP